MHGLSIGPRDRGQDACGASVSSSRRSTSPGAHSLGRYWCRHPSHIENPCLCHPSWSGGQSGQTPSHEQWLHHYVDILHPSSSDCVANQSRQSSRLKQWLQQSQVQEVLLVTRSEAHPKALADLPLRVTTLAEDLRQRSATSASATLAAMAKRESAGSTDEELVTLLDLLQHPFLEAAPHDRLSRQSMASHQGVSWNTQNRQ